VLAVVGVNLVMRDTLFRDSLTVAVSDKGEDDGEGCENGESQEKQPIRPPTVAVRDHWRRISHSSPQECVVREAQRHILRGRHSGGFLFLALHATNLLAFIDVPVFLAVQTGEV
jgi:hypothetical protein